MVHQERRGVVPIQLPAVPSFDPSVDPNTISKWWNKLKKKYFVYYIEALVSQIMYKTETHCYI